jgi:hypothetical protein
MARSSIIWNNRCLSILLSRSGAQVGNDEGKEYQGHDGVEPVTLELRAASLGFIILLVRAHIKWLTHGAPIRWLTALFLTLP